MNQEGMNAHKIATGGRSECNVRADGEVWVRVNGRKSMETSSSSETINQSINSYAVFRNERTVETRKEQGRVLKNDIEEVRSASRKG
jgi:hypothetical protein